MKNGRIKEEYPDLDSFFCKKEEKSLLAQKKGAKNKKRQIEEESDEYCILQNEKSARELNDEFYWCFSKVEKMSSILLGKRLTKGEMVVISSRILEKNKPILSRHVAREQSIILQYEESKLTLKQIEERFGDVSDS